MEVDLIEGVDTLHSHMTIIGRPGWGDEPAVPLLPPGGLGQLPVGPHGAESLVILVGAG